MLYIKICDICCINLFKKYLFALIVSSYVLTVIGIPVYFHYCGGELEEINYVLKSTSCCDGEEDNSAEEDNGCCKDENLVLKSNIDFTIKDSNPFAFVKTYCDLFYISLPFSISVQPEIINLFTINSDSPPYKLQRELVISTSVLRI